jgi:putative tryptophan/tyrosine transport system substrate-binding protein
MVKAGLAGSPHMRRRDFISIFGSAAAVWPRAARTQQAMPVIGYLHVGWPQARRDQVAAFQRGLSEAGFVEGRDVIIEYRWAEDQYDRLPGFLSDLIHRRVAIIVAAAGTNTVLAAKALNITIPIVFSTSGDPVRSGLVASLNQPGGNVTGVVDMGADLAAKQVGLLHELLPRAERFAVLFNPKNEFAGSVTTDVQTAASAIGRQVEVLAASANSDIDAAFASLIQKRADALLVAPDTLFTTRRVQLVTLAARHVVPTMYALREFVEAGGLMSYGASIVDRERLLGIYVGRILKGEKPADLPILRASKFEFVINLQTAKTLGIDVPATLTARADEVIE